VNAQTGCMNAPKFVTSRPINPLIHATYTQFPPKKAGTNFATWITYIHNTSKVIMSLCQSNVSFNAAESSLLEGLFQMAARGETQSNEFQQISDEIYDRLFQAYEA
jgi:hypothetical protein